MTELNVTKASARATIRKLIEVHRRTLKDIDDGKRFHKDGSDITQELRRRVEREIKQCQQVDDALDYMGAGDIRKAADLCGQIQEFI